jgi:hypothetical protein
MVYGARQGSLFQNAQNVKIFDRYTTGVRGSGVNYQNLQLGDFRHARLTSAFPLR